MYDVFITNIKQFIANKWSNKYNINIQDNCFNYSIQIKENICYTQYSNSLV